MCLKSSDRMTNSQTLVILNPCPAEPRYTLPANSVDPDQLASEEANWSGSALFVIKYVNLYQKPGSSNLIGSGRGILIYSAWQGLRPVWSESALFVQTCLLRPVSPILNTILGKNFSRHPETGNG